MFAPVEKITLYKPVGTGSFKFRYLDSTPLQHAYWEGDRLTYRILQKGDIFEGTSGMMHLYQSGRASLFVDDMEMKVPK